MKNKYDALDSLIQSTHFAKPKSNNKVWILGFVPTLGRRWFDGKNWKDLPRNFGYDPESFAKLKSFTLLQAQVIVNGERPRNRASEIEIVNDEGEKIEARFGESASTLEILAGATVTLHFKEGTSNKVWGYREKGGGKAEIFWGKVGAKLGTQIVPISKAQSTHKAKLAKGYKPAGKSTKETTTTKLSSRGGKYVATRRGRKAEATTLGTGETLQEVRDRIASLEKSLPTMKTDVGRRTVESTIRRAKEKERRMLATKNKPHREESNALEIYAAAHAGDNTAHKFDHDGHSFTVTNENYKVKGGDLHRVFRDSKSIGRFTVFKKSDGSWSTPSEHGSFRKDITHNEYKPLLKAAAIHQHESFNKMNPPPKKKKVTAGDNIRIGQTIMEQLGANKFIVMTGAKRFMWLSNGVQFDIPTANKINRVTVRLTPTDEYNVEFGYMRGMDYKVVKKVDGIQAAELQNTFTNATGLRTRL